MKKYRLKKSAIYAIYTSLAVALVGTLLVLDNSLNNKSLQNDEYNYVESSIFDNEVPVIASDNTIGKPYINNEVKVVKNYYDRNASEDVQQNSIIYYETTYMQNSAIAYGGVESFDVVAVFDGTVSSIREDDLLGYIVEIVHKNNVISIYQSVSDVLVKENQNVKKGEKIAKSGKSNLNQSLNLKI